MWESPAASRPLPPGPGNAAEVSAKTSCRVSTMGTASGSRLMSSIGASGYPLPPARDACAAGALIERCPTVNRREFLTTDRWRSARREAGVDLVQVDLLAVHNLIEPVRVQADSRSSTTVPKSSYPQAGIGRFRHSCRTP